MAKKKPTIIRTNDKLRVEVDKNHNYNSRCQCMACLQFWLAFASGEIEVLSPDGRRMVPPGTRQA